jgi:hypothetical protein
MDTCVLCGTDEKPFLSPVRCIIQHGFDRSHKICQECWFRDFAREGMNHKCPGCENGTPLKEPVKIIL